jgi:hypothetical protein
VCGLGGVTATSLRRGGGRLNDEDDEDDDDDDRGLDISISISISNCDLSSHHSSLYCLSLLFTVSLWGSNGKEGE